MATISTLPFISQSVLRRIRSGSFSGKEAFGPQTTAAIVEGSQRAESLGARESARIDAQLAESKRQSDESTRLSEARLAQQDRQFEQSQKAKAESESATRFERRKAAQEAEPGFFEGLFGS